MDDIYFNKYSVNISIKCVQFYQIYKKDVKLFVCLLFFIENTNITYI